MSHLPVTDAEPSRALYRRIPAIEQLLRHPQIQPLLAHYGNTLITEQLRQLQQLARQHIQTHHSLPNWVTIGHKRCSMRCNNAVWRRHGYLTSLAQYCIRISAAPRWRRRQ